MKQILFLIFLLTACFLVSGQNIDDLSFGTDSTFEVATWNIEWFPKNGQTTVEYVKDIIEALDIDLLAIQEVDDTVAFNLMVGSLSSYNGYLKSAWFAGLAYIYKPDVLQINSIYEIYTTSQYWSAFPRSPMVMDLNYMNERIIVINNHFKCCGDGTFDINDQNDEETRRYNAINLLKEYIDANFPSENTIVVGDLNDILTDITANNVFQEVIDDNENYLFADSEIASGSNTEWSFPTWPSHLDHILITNELFDEFESENSTISTIKVDEYIGGDWWKYDNNISDHRPVAIKLHFNLNTGLVNSPASKPSFSNYPNSFSSETTLSFTAPNDNARIEIFNINGQSVFLENISGQQTSIIWNPNSLPNGVYFAKLVIKNKEIATTKLILKR
ncbi:MAG: endonuclease/exonuclease/phosphatase family protein [Clostridiales bacterium]|nr:endonuclease/exonuclease/phosphatase family protein [Clostridiales bacterium]